MSLPKREDLERVILLELDAGGGETASVHLCERARQHFPEMSDEEADQILRYGDRRWPTCVRYAKWRLVERGEVRSVKRGVWAITDRGRERVRELRER